MTMDIRTDHKQQLEGLMDHLFALAAHETPSKVDWDELSLALKEDAIFLREYILPKITVAPRYVGGATRIAEFVPPERPDIELRPEDSAAGVPFLPTGNGAR